MNQKKNRILLIIVTMAILLGGIFGSNMAMTAHAKPESVFSIDAELLPGDRETYDIRLTVENQGADWEGVVRLIVDEGYRRPNAYDTSLSLPQGSRKQFVVRVPVNSIDSSNGTIIVTLLDRNDEEAVTKEFRRLLMGQMEALSMGILSDAYADLTYLDMGGKEVYFYNDFYPVRLVELKQGSLEDELDALTFLVIDKYNTDILTSDELTAIETWNANGGVLIIGTGAYAEDTLGGFEDSYLGITYNEIDTLDDVSYYNESEYVDWSQLTTVALLNTSFGYSSSYNDYYLGAFFGSIGDGSVCALSYSLVELGKADGFYLDTTQEEYVNRFLENACGYARSRYSSSSYYNDNNYYIQNMMGVVGNSNSILNFNVLKGIVIGYVIFAGPVLYLILRFLKRRELYWVAVPVTAVLGIVIVFFAGRGFEVVSTQVYSVSVKNLSDSGKTVTYLHCYDANRREWNLRLADGCEYAGPLNTSYSYDDESYYYHIKREGDTFFVGLNPDSNFEDGYFCLGRPASGDWIEGRISMQNLAIDAVGNTGPSNLKGTIVNDTNQDMDYFAIIKNGSLYVFEGLSAGEACDLQNTTPLYHNSGYYFSSYMYSFLDDFYDDGDYEKVSILSALGVGIYSISQQLDDNEFAVIGVVENWENTVNDDCSEISYGCLYSVQ